MRIYCALFQQWCLESGTKHGPISPSIALNKNLGHLFRWWHSRCRADEWRHHWRAQQTVAIGNARRTNNWELRASPGFSSSHFFSLVSSGARILVHGRPLVLSLGAPLNKFDLTPLAAKIGWFLSRRRRRGRSSLLAAPVLSGGISAT
jgi:hypothetical protein